MTYKSLLWLLPFTSFAVGYLLANYFFASASFPTPAIVGLPLTRAAKILSDNQLNMRIIGEKADPTVKPETIIHQQPGPGLRIKSHQTVFVVIAQAPISPRTPNFLGLTHQQAEDLFAKQGITGKWYTLACDAPLDTVIAQDPAPDTDLSKSITLYQAAPYESRIILPRFVGRSLAEVADFLTKHHLPFNAVYPEGTFHSTKTFVIREQRPLAGSLIEPNKPPTVQLLVEEPSAAPPETLPGITAQTMAM